MKTERKPALSEGWGLSESPQGGLHVAAPRGSRVARLQPPTESRAGRLNAVADGRHRPRPKEKGLERNPRCPER